MKVNFFSIIFFFVYIVVSIFYLFKERKGGSTRKRIFPPLPKILLCAHPRKEWALPSRCKKCKSRQPSSRTACLITVTAQPGMLNDERGGLVLSAWLDEWWLWEQRIFGAFLSLLCKSWLLKNRFSWVKLKNEYENQEADKKIAMHNFKHLLLHSLIFFYTQKQKQKQTFKKEKQLPNFVHNSYSPVKLHQTISGHF